MKKCADCKRELSDDQFTKSNPWYCRECKGARYRSWYRRRRELERALAEPKRPVTEKTCKRCGELKPITDFYMRRGEQPYFACKPCSIEINAQRKALRESKGLRGYDRLKYRCNRMGVTVDWYLGKEREQDGKCAICGCPETHPHFKGSDQIRSLAIDHSHENGRVRGLLCFRCNTALYQLEKHGLEWADHAVEYLKQYQETKCNFLASPSSTA